MRNCNYYCPTDMLPRRRKKWLLIHTNKRKSWKVRQKSVNGGDDEDGDEPSWQTCARIDYVDNKWRKAISGKRETDNWRSATMGCSSRWRSFYVIDRKRSAMLVWRWRRRRLGWNEAECDDNDDGDDEEHEIITNHRETSKSRGAKALIKDPLLTQLLWRVRTESNRCCCCCCCCCFCCCCCYIFFLALVVVVFVGNVVV